jgi:hypothetical protein
MVGAPKRSPKWLTSLSDARIAFSKISFVACCYDRRAGFNVMAAVTSSCLKTRILRAVVLNVSSWAER